MKRRTVVKKIAFCLIGACVAMVLATPALAEKGKELKDAAKLMQDGWKMFNDGQSMIIKGKEMNDLVAVQQGAAALMVPGTR